MNKYSKYIVLLSLILCLAILTTGCKKDTPVVEEPTGPHLIDDSVENVSPDGDTDSTEIVVENDAVGADPSDSTEQDPNHVHNYTVAATTEATCEKAGMVTKQCSCGSSKTETISALGHDYKETTSTAATCTTPGSSVKVCSRCKDKKTENIAAKGHNYQVTSTTKPTCSTSGSEVKTCSNCNDKQTTTLSKLNHTYQTSKTAATCTEQGKEISKCSTCGAVGQTKNTPALGHDWEDTVTKEATCTTEGAKDRKCKRCKTETKATIEKAAHEYEVVETPPTCDKAGKKEEICSVCGNIKTRTNLPATGHKYVESVEKEATCTDKGVKKFTCSACEHAKTETIPALGHDYKETAKTEATCTTDGSLTKTCARCEDAITTTISATGHTEICTENKKATCAEEGNGTKTCSVCAADLGTYTIPVTSCDAANIVPSDSCDYADFTCSQCSVCGKKCDYVFTISQSQAAETVLGYVNQLRAANGLSSLSLSSDSCSSAQNRAQSIAGNFTASTNECIARDVTSLRAMFDKWVNSESNRAALLKEDATSFGFGYYTNGQPSLFGVAIIN